MTAPPIDDFTMEIAISNNLVKIVDNTNIRLPFKWISSFYRNNDDTISSLKETYEGIVNYLDSKEVEASEGIL